jgi:predicted RNase H-like HicB family nuclease
LLSIKYFGIIKSMKKPELLQFIIQPDEQGGFTAAAVGYSIYTQGETVDETIKNIREAVNCHFFEEDQSRLPLPIFANVYIPEIA